MSSPKPNSTPNRPQHAVTASILLLLLFTLLLSLSFAFLISHLLSPKIAYVETVAVIKQFTLASRVNDQIEQERARWQEDLKMLEDSLKASPHYIQSFINVVITDNELTEYEIDCKQN